MTTAAASARPPHSSAVSTSPGSELAHHRLRWPTTGTLIAAVLAPVLLAAARGEYAFTVLGDVVAQEATPPAAPAAASAFPWCGGGRARCLVRRENSADSARDRHDLPDS